MYEVAVENIMAKYSDEHGWVDRDAFVKEMAAYIDEQVSEAKDDAYFNAYQEQSLAAN